MDQGYPVPRRISRRPDHDRLSGHGHPAFVRAHGASDHLAERGFPSPVLADERVQFAALHLDGDVIESYHARIALDDSADRDMGSAVSGQDAITSLL